MLSKQLQRGRRSAENVSLLCNQLWQAYTRRMDRFVPLLYIALWFVSLFAGSYIINWLLIRSVIRKYYRWFVAPGVIVHELSHALGCLITRSEIVEIKLWEPTGGHVKHIPSHETLLGKTLSEPIIALAPIWGTLLILWGLTIMVVPGLLNYGGIVDLFHVLSSIDWASWQTWLYFYIVTSLLATIAPSKTDLSYAVGSLLFICAAMVGLLYVPGLADLLINMATALMPFVIFTLTLLTVGLTVSFLLAIPYRNKHFVPRNQLD